MFRVLFVLFVLIPIIEIAVLMHVGALIGAWPTIAIVVVTAWLGAKNVRQQGLATLTSVQNKMAQGQMPSDEIVHGLMLLVAGVLLVTPGFVTDAFGLSLLIPAVRQSIVATVQKQMLASQNVHTSFHFDSQQTQYNHQEKEIKDPFESKLSDRKSSHVGETLDGEFERKN